jgi:hypothetical protein
MRERADGNRHMTPRLRKLILAASVISIALDVMDLAFGHVAGGIVLAGLGSIALVSVLQNWKTALTGADAATSFQLIKAYSFFCVNALVGIAVFVLAAVGAIRDPVLYGSLGLVAACGSIYVLVGGRYPRGR